MGYQQTYRFIPITLCLFVLSFFGENSFVYAQTQFERRPITNEAWLEPFPPVRIIGNLYHVGTSDLASYLITTPEGHILVNTGAYDSAELIRENIEELGFSFEDIKILLTQQAHWDHVADLAVIKRATGARMLAHEDDVAALEDGGNTDYRFPEGRGTHFEPVMVDEQLQHGDTIELGGTVITLHHHGGHTRGASSFTFDSVDDDGKVYSVLIVNMGSINGGVSLLDMPGFPEIASVFESTYAAQKLLSRTTDIWVSSHSGHFDLHEKFSPGDSYDPSRFMDPEGYKEKIRFYENAYLKQFQEEREQASKTITTESGLIITATQEGSGIAAEEGNFVSVHYTGWLYDADAEGGRGTKFDSSVDRNSPFEFSLGAGRVIAGWDEGVVGMLIDEKRELIIPPELGYGSRGAGNVIPPDSTLLFEVQLLAVE
jgi:metallo-beta-lactamase class B